MFVQLISVGKRSLGREYGKQEKGWFIIDILSWKYIHIAGRLWGEPACHWWIINKIDILLTLYCEFVYGQGEIFIFRPLWVI